MRNRSQLAIRAAGIAAILWLIIILSALYMGPAISSGALFWGLEGIAIWIVGIAVVVILMFIILNL